MSQPVDTRPRPASTDAAELGLRHVLIVGGTPAEWAALSDRDWEHRIAVLGSACDALGADWLTIRVYGPGDDPVDEPETTRHEVGRCSVLVDPHGDGRRRFAEAMRRIAAGVAVSEASVAQALYAPADVEPDLVIVLGPATQLPPSLVWELAYAELVFLPVAWAALTADHLTQAAGEFAGRRRRFGGLDQD